MNNLFWVKAKILFSNKQTKLIIYLTFFVFIFITSVGLFLYENYKGILDRDLNQPYTELLQINLGVTNRAFREADDQAVKVSFHSSTLNYVQGELAAKQKDASLLSSYLNTIALNEDIYSIYVLDLKNKLLVSDKSAQSLDWASFPDQTWAPWVETMKTKPLLIKRRSLGSENKQGTVELISLYRPIIKDHELIGVVIVNVDYDRFFSKIYPQLDTPQYIFSLEGDVIYPKLGTEVPLQELYKAVEMMGVRPFAEVKLEGQSYLGNQAFSDMTGWRWVSLIPLDELLKDVRRVRDLVFLLSLASIIVGSAAIFFYNFAAFKPIKRIRQLLASNDSVSSGSDTDLHDLEAVVKKLLQEFDSTSSVAERSLPELRSKYIQDVLMGRIGSKELHNKWETYFVQWTNDELIAAAVSINRYTEWFSTSGYSEEDQLLLKYALVNIVSELLETKWRIHCVPLDKENLMLVIQSKEGGKQASGEILQDALSTMTKTATKYLKMSLSVGIGQPCESISSLHHSFEEAKAALANRLYEGYDKTIRFTDVTQRESLLDTDVDVWKAEIMESLESTDVSMSSQVLGRWAEWVRERQFAPESIYTFVNQLIGDFSRIIALRGISRPTMLDNYTEHQLRMMDLDDLHQLLLHVAEAIVSGIQLHKTTKEYHLAQRITRFMEEHLHEQIGLQEVADFMNLSTSSVSSVYKMETGNTIYECLTKMRIDHACHLLSTTDRRIADIALQVGYQNENSFIRSFRKLKSVTPGKYRDANKQY
ncbi:helix-turn-helix domain-containing protein [Paenibacillus sp. LMG 31456]|uniref:Helix-turn-helix domain-containing protein n=1 Tax=Paenibacillus foliorum TaxID=2654974 RepID=A0A972GXF5_9BACL|nr:helix-turn-helix domain-containing protein [Paenibacillus foliorum]NOU94650.1 helix-turn-helix domain-containing protein [Paenibacillus foliorum]